MRVEPTGMGLMFLKKGPQRAPQLLSSYERKTESL